MCREYRLEGVRQVLGITVTLPLADDGVVEVYAHADRWNPPVSSCSGRAMVTGPHWEWVPSETSAGSPIRRGIPMSTDLAPNVTRYPVGQLTARIPGRVGEFLIS